MGRGSAVGTFFHSIRLIAPSGATETLEALVDTGAMFTSYTSTSNVSNLDRD
jgi:hypothetical protein